MKDVMKFAALAVGTVAGAVVLIAAVSLMCWMLGGEVMP